jgi:hypothetical protein
MILAINAGLGHRRSTIQNMDFPPAAAAVPLAPAILQPIVDAMATMTRANRDRDVLRAAEAANKVAPSRVWEADFAALLRMCHQAAEVDLPPSWARLAKAGPKHSRCVLDAAARAPAANGTHSLPSVGRPLISPELARAVFGLQFFERCEDLESCLSIFAVSFPDADSVTAANEVIGLYDLQSNGSASPTVSDMLDMKKARALRLPVDWFQLRMVLGAYHRLLQILLGKDHPVPQGIRMLVGVLEDAAPVYLKHELKGAYKCAEVMTAVNTYMWSWADQQARRLAHVLPNYGRLAEQFQLRDWKPPALPAQLRAAIKPATAAAAAAAHRSTATTAPTADTDKNDKNDARVPGVFDANVSVYWLLKTARPSKLPSGRMPCLNYHVHGSCSATCPYHLDHIKHSAEDSAHLAKYMAEHSAAAKAASAKV